MDMLWSRDSEETSASLYGRKDQTSVQVVSLLEEPAFSGVSTSTFPGIFTPDLKPHWQCVGYTLKGDRCRNSNASGSYLTAQVDRLRHASRIYIEDLRPLASQFLCKRWHQKYADRIAYLWLYQLESRPRAAPVPKPLAIQNTQGSRITTSSSISGSTARIEALPQIQPAPKQIAPHITTSEEHQQTVEKRSSATKDDDPSGGTRATGSQPQSNTLFVTQSDCLVRRTIVTVQEVAPAVGAHEPKVKSEGDKPEPTSPLLSENLLSVVKTESESVEAKPAHDVSKDSGLLVQVKTERNDGSEKDKLRPKEASNLSLSAFYYRKCFEYLTSTVKNSLTQTRTTCMASTKSTSGRCCKTLIKDRIKAEPVLDRFASLKLPYDLDLLPVILTDLASAIFCEQEHQLLGSKLAIDIVRHTSVLRRIDPSHNASQVTAYKAVMALTDWIEILDCEANTKKLPSRKAVAKILGSPSTISASFPGDLKGSPLQDPSKSPGGANSPKSIKLTLHGILNGLPARNLTPYHPKTQRLLSVSDAIRAALTREFNSIDEKLGFVYGYCFAPDFGNIKIGYTSRSVATRLEEWGQKCGRAPTQIHPTIMDARDPVPHVYRLERLIHAELTSCRRRERGCYGCRGNHDEWFATSVQHVWAVMRKWTTWIRSKPYEQFAEVSYSHKGGHVVKMRWRLKEEHRKDLVNLCQPLRFAAEIESSILGTRKVWDQAVGEKKTPKVAGCR